MGKKDTTSHTSENHNPFTRPLGGHKTEITENPGDFLGSRTHTGYGTTPEESQDNASEEYREAHRRENEDSGDGLCYLTTACVTAMDLPDNCIELLVLRRFRDSVLLPTPMGRASVEDYYIRAPDIVQAVDERQDSQVIWRGLYGDINRAVHLVLTGRFNEAFEHYRDMSNKLKEKFT